MSSVAALDSEYPFTALVRASDRDGLLVGIVTAVWEEMLDLPLSVRDDGDELDGAEQHGDILTGVIHIVGDWNGTVALAAPPSLATEFASRMLAAPPEALTKLEIEDTWGEMVNMVGGNLKALVPPPTQLSLPAVIAGQSYAYRVPNGRTLNEVTFACLGRRIRLTVIQHEGR
ncbi:MAG: chemotaxis protein CheX [Gemmatimonadales bacterium]|nr:chemotaxis protein CheX [Gemmatimonadales bacterium]